MDKATSGRTTNSQRLKHDAFDFLRAVPIIVAVEERPGREFEY